MKMQDRPNVIKSEFLNDGSGLKYIEWAGASRHSKPTSAIQANGCLFHEVDTAKIWAYDAGTQTWHEQIQLGGGA